MRIYLPYGRYYYSVEANGYKSYEGSTFINDEDRWDNVNLTPEEQPVVPVAKEEQPVMPVAKEEQRDKDERISEQKQKEQRPRIQQPKRPRPENKRDKQGVVFGLTGGINMASAQFGKDYEGEVTALNGFYAGVTAEMRLGSNFYLNTGVLYSSKGYKYENEGNNINETGKAQFVDIPLLLSPRIPLGSGMHLELNAGLYAALCIGGNVKDEWDGDDEPAYDEKFSKVYDGFDYGLQAGGAIIISSMFRIGASYQIGMGSKYQNRNIMVGLGIRF